MPTQKNSSVLLKAEFNINGTNSLRAGQTCPISFVARGKVAKSNAAFTLGVRTRCPSTVLAGH